MILIVNAENTNICIGCALESQGTILFEDHVSMDIKRTAAEYSIMFKQILELNGIAVENVSGGVIASCVPPATDTIKSAMKRLLNKDILEVGPGVRTGVDIRIDDPGELGADLIVSAAAGIEHYGAPLVIIDLNTLITFSVINKKGQFIGAIFEPGIRLSSEMIGKSAANLPETAARPSVRLIGTNSAESIKSGVFNGCAASVDGLIDRISEELGADDGLTAVITGEFAEDIAKRCSHSLIVDMHLSMKGLINIYNKNAKRRS